MDTSLLERLILKQHEVDMHGCSSGNLAAVSVKRWRDLESTAAILAPGSLMHSLALANYVEAKAYGNDSENIENIHASYLILKDAMSRLGYLPILVDAAFIAMSRVFREYYSDCHFRKDMQDISEMQFHNFKGDYENMILVVDILDELGTCLSEAGMSEDYIATKARELAYREAIDTTYHCVFNYIGMIDASLNLSMPLKALGFYKAALKLADEGMLLHTVLYDNPIVLSREETVSWLDNAKKRLDAHQTSPSRAALS
jgi:hypothetical protein